MIWRGIEAKRKTAKMHEDCNRQLVPKLYIIILAMGFLKQAHGESRAGLRNSNTLVDATVLVIMAFLIVQILILR